MSPFYASAFRCRRHYVFGLSVRPSVRSLKYPLLTCTWVRWSIRPNVTVFVRPFGEVFGHLPENVWRKSPEILHADVSWPSSELFSLWLRSVDFCQFWRYFDLVKRVKFEVSGHFLENALRKWPEILHADVSWPPPELISLWRRSVDFSNFGIILI